MVTHQDTAAAEAEARAQVKNIVELVQAIKDAAANEEKEAAEQAVYEDALSVTVRSGWHTPGDKGELEEYQILLSTGGPAVRIVGEFGRFNDPSSGQVQYQDWATPWTPYPLTEDEQAAVLEYARVFYYGE